MQQKDKYLTDEQVAHGFSWEPYVEDVIILLYGGREIIDPDTHHNYTFSENGKDATEDIRKIVDQYWAWLNSGGSTDIIQD
ncbi:hypothetical protein CY91_04765 [Dehalococcoides mccartyi]|uniref:hypothetical protein n=1 Tax=Dehalococcoides mccartyi TaxID=61435 RepID=UPI00071CCF40|nr:hypothetical protein [Dehalococcoides mccartyi]KSV17094.1 hypothetical protein CY91_04765 [Dehalococcoides mccartyi]